MRDFIKMTKDSLPIKLMVEVQNTLGLMDEEKTVPGKEDFFLFISPSSNPNGWYNIC